MNLQFTLREIIIAAVPAFIITVLVIEVWEILRVRRGHAAPLNYQAKDIRKILQRCYRLFPSDIIQFNGMTFRRGMKVHVTTNQMKDFEGRLIGMSKENMICILTNKYIIAHELTKIKNMYLCAEEEKLKV